MPNVRMGFHLLLAAWHSKHTRVVFMITNAIALNATARTAPPGRQRTFMAAPIVLKLRVYTATVSAMYVYVLCVR